MNLFGMKKKKEPLQELETPPLPEGTPEAVPSPQQPGEVPGFSMDAPEQYQQEMPLNALQDVPLPPEDMKAQPEMQPTPSAKSMQQVPIPEMPKIQPQTPPVPKRIEIPTPTQMPEPSFQRQMQMPMESGFPKPDDIFKQDLPAMQSLSQNYPTQQSFAQSGMFRPEPTVTFYNPEPKPENSLEIYGKPNEMQEEHEEYEEHAEDVSQGSHDSHESMLAEETEVPYDLTQELLSLPKNAIKQEVRPVHMSKKFLSVAMLLDIGSQLINVHDDVVLGKDTAFRLSDLNEQEIEKMARWHALHQSMELRMAEIDKILFKA